MTFTISPDYRGRIARRAVVAQPAKPVPVALVVFLAVFVFLVLL